MPIPDVFDQQLNNSCSIVMKKSPGTGSDDVYGQPSQSFITNIASWPMRQSTMKGGSEYKVGKEFAKNTFRFFMRPPTVDDAMNPFTLTTHNWLSVNGVFYNITGINDPSQLGHHLEVVAEQVIP